MDQRLDLRQRGRRNIRGGALRCGRLTRARRQTRVRRRRRGRDGDGNRGMQRTAAPGGHRLLRDIGGRLGCCPDGTNRRLVPRAPSIPEDRPGARTEGDVENAGEMNLRRRDREPAPILAHRWTGCIIKSNAITSTRVLRPRQTKVCGRDTSTSVWPVWFWRTTRIRYDAAGRGEKGDWIRKRTLF